MTRQHDAPLDGGVVDRRRLLGLAGLGVAGMVLAGASCATDGPTTVSGVGGSEKKQFFDDSEVTKLLQAKGYKVNYDLSGSREIADLKDRSYDLAFPAGGPAEERIRKEPTDRNKPIDPQQYVPFSTLMVIGTFRSNAEALAGERTRALVGAQVVRREGTGDQARFVLGIREYLALLRKEVRWRDLQADGLGNSGKLVWISTTDPAKSNSGGQFLALLSYVANNDRIVTGTAEADAALGEVRRAFSVQGAKAPSTEYLFDSYQTHGQGTTPLAALYEAQFLSRQAASDNPLPKDWVMMYTDPAILTHHAVVPFTLVGKEVARLLVDDPDLQRSAVRLGYRGRNPGQFEQFFADRQIAVLPHPQNVVNAPSYDDVEYMIKNVE